MADNGGLRIAYNAFKHWKSLTEADRQHLPGITLNSEQIFFLAFAQLWCGTYTDTFAKRAMEIDVHSPYPHRVLGALSNMPEFSAAFQCKPGTKYHNNNSGCTLW